MWAVRILSGPQAGQTFDLKMGRNLIGRAPQCDIKITSAGVSKEHTEINVTKEKITVTDLKSSNGTFINGIKVQNTLVRLGDKISIHDIIVDIVPASEGLNVLRSQQAAANYVMPQQAPSPMPMPGPSAPTPAPASPAYNPNSPIKQMIAQFQDYLDRSGLAGSL